MTSIDQIRKEINAKGSIDELLDYILSKKNLKDIEDIEEYYSIIEKKYFRYFINQFHLDEYNAKKIQAINSILSTQNISLSLNTECTRNHVIVSIKFYKNEDKSSSNQRKYAKANIFMKNNQIRADDEEIDGGKNKRYTKKKAKRRIKTKRSSQRKRRSRHSY